MRSIRQLALTAVALVATSSAFAAQTTVEFKSFYDTSTIFNPFDTKGTASVATLVLKEVNGGVEGALEFKDTTFPGNNLSISHLYLESGAKGAVALSSGTPLSGTFYKNGFYKDFERYNYDIKYSNSFAEGSTSKFTISNVSLADFLTGEGKDAVVNGILLDVTNVGKPYTGFLGLNKNVHFIGSIVPVPEPSTYALMGLGLIGVMAAARRRQAA